MKVVSVIGLTHSGKTTVIETIIKGLRRRGFSVASVKEIHFDEFAIDTPGTNTDRHRKAGAQLVSALGLNETDILFQEKLPIRKLLSFYDHDYVILEGVNDPSIPLIVTGHNTEEVEERLCGSVFALSGILADHMNEYNGLKVIHCLKEPDRLVDVVQQNAFELLPGFDSKCCGLCGADCDLLCEKIVKGQAKRADCLLKNDNIKLTVNNKEIKMVPFVQSLLRNAVLGVVSELDGFKKDSHMEIEIGIPEKNRQLSE